MFITAEIGRNVVFLRNQIGLTQERLALAAEISVSNLRRVEQRTANPTVKTLSRIADALGVPFNAVASANGRRADTS